MTLSKLLRIVAMFMWMPPELPKKRVLISSCYLIKHFNITGSKIGLSSKKRTSARWRIPWGEGIGVAARGVAIVPLTVSVYVDFVSSTKSRPIITTPVCGVPIFSWLDQKLNRIVPTVVVVKRVDKAFAGIGVCWIWNKDIRVLHLHGITKKNLNDLAK